MSYNKLFIKSTCLIVFSLFLFSCKHQLEDKIIVGEVDSSEIDVGVKVPGRISDIYVAEGDSISKGQSLGKLESKELDAKLDVINAALKDANNQYTLAKKTYNRIKNLYKNKVIPKQQFDEVEYKYKAAFQKVKAVQGQLNEIKAYYLELTIVSPIDGEVVQIIANPGELVSTGYPIITILNPKNMWVVFNIHEDDLKNIEKGKNYQVFFPALNKTFEMEVVYISALGTFASWKPTAQQGNYDLKTFEIRLKSKGLIPNLRPGMTAVLK
ncbi:MAG: efflux RND transporter periplasmic adaptor subunit [Endomicrobium sp.]|jgi:HlyD family secretion protein|nr:efflux RND transporter periplasmic adaptor subunit [Endomicrobium sp.]